MGFNCSSSPLIWFPCQTSKKILERFSSSTSWSLQEEHRRYRRVRKLAVSPLFVLYLILAAGRPLTGGGGSTNDSIGRPASSVDSLTHLVDFLRLSVTWTAADMDSSQADVDSSQANVDSSQADVDSSQASQRGLIPSQRGLSPSRRGLTQPKPTWTQLEELPGFPGIQNRWKAPMTISNWNKLNLNHHN